MPRITCEECGVEGAVTIGHKICRRCWLRSKAWEKQAVTPSTDWFVDEQGNLARRYGAIEVSS